MRILNYKGIQQLQSIIQLQSCLRMLEKIKKTRNIYHYLAYCISTVISGVFSMAVGSIIPYLAEESGKKQTDYSFLLACKGYGMLLGAICLTCLKKTSFCPVNHVLLMLSSLGIALSSILFMNVESSIYQGIYMFVGSFSLMILDVSINMSTIALTSGDLLQFWMQIIWSFFSLGAILAPLLVYIFGKYTYTIIFLLASLNSIGYFFLKSPEIIKQQLQKQNKSSNDIQQDQNSTEIAQLTTSGGQKQITNRICYELCFLMFSYIGFMISIVMWIPSYAVITQISTKEEANIFPSIFWIGNTIFKFIVAFVPLKSSQKVRYSIFGSIFVLIFTLIAIKMDYVLFAIYAQSILIGILISPMYASIFAVVKEFGYTLKGDQASSISTCGALGQALVSPLVGILMALYTEAIFMFGLLLALIMMLTIVIVVKQFNKQLKKDAIQDRKDEIEVDNNKSEIEDKKDTIVDNKNEIGDKITSTAR